LGKESGPPQKVKLKIEIFKSKMLKKYLKKICEIAHRGDAREESYYSTLEELLEDYTTSTGKQKIHITTLPKRTEAGNPDLCLSGALTRQVKFLFLINSLPARSGDLAGTLEIY
jgi:hypothetical protein